MKGKIILLLLVISMQSMAQEEVLYVPNIQTDFIPDGKASNEHWQFFFEGTDTKVTSSYRKDFSDMYKADVFEVFLHPQPEMPLYFEYEINPFNKELVLLIPNLRKGIAGWQPWHYTGAKKTIKKVHIQRENGKMTGWSAEVFIPFSLLSPLENNPPKKGTTWKGTFCRLDYDSGKMIKWSWAPIKVGFHEYKNYWTIVFD